MSLQDSYPELMKQARALQERGHYDRAFEIYRRVLQRLSRLGSEALQKREELLDTLLQAGIAAIAIPRGGGDYDLALEMADTLESAMPDMSKTLLLLRAQTHADAGRIDQAMELLRSAAGSDDTTLDDRLEYAVEALWNKRAEDVLLFTEPAKLDGEAVEEEERGRIPQLWFIRFRAQSMLGQMEDAEASWNQARLLSPDDPPTSMEMVEMFIRHENQEKALRYADMEENLAMRGMLRGLVAELSGKHEWAVDEWWRVTREAFDVESDDFAAWIECALRQSDTSKAEAAITAGLEKDPTSARLLLYQALKMVKDGQLETALDQLGQIAAMHHSARFNRQRLIFETDRWLLEQSIADPDARASVAATLFDDKPAGEDDEDSPESQPAAEEDGE